MQKERGITVIQELIVDYEGLRFKELDFENWGTQDWMELTLKNFKSGAEGVEADLWVGTNKVVDVKIKNIGVSSSEELLQYLVEDLKRLHGVEPIEIKAENVELDTVDESLLDGAIPSQEYDKLHVLENKGFVRGAIIERSNGSNKTYGIFTGQFYKSEGDTVGLCFTDGSTWHESFCTLVDDVNKDILRMVSAEQGRILEDAQQFIELIERKVTEIIYGI